MNRGFYGNTRVGGWSTYPVEVKAIGTGSEVQPFFDTSAGATLGKWLYDPSENLVSVQIQTQFIRSTTIGSGLAYCWRLPMKARRIGQLRANSPVPIGRALCYLSFQQNPQPSVNMPCTVTLASTFTSLAGAEDYYAQIYAPEIWDWGSTTVTATANPWTINHRYTEATPNARDIYARLTTVAGAPTGASNPTDLAVTATAATTFTVDTINGSSFSGPAGGLGIVYKIKGIPPVTSGGTGALVSPTVPWDWSRFDGTFGPFGNIFIELEYEAA